MHKTVGAFTLAERAPRELPNFLETPSPEQSMDSLGLRLLTRTRVLGLLGPIVLVALVAFVAYGFFKSRRSR